MAGVCFEAAMGPIRNISIDKIRHISSDKVTYYNCTTDVLIIHLLKVRTVRYEDFVEALQVVHPSVSFRDLKVYEEWNKLYGCGR